jgi:DNA helicase-2/ATP-dependent DNA helicase PcrA
MPAERDRLLAGLSEEQRMAVDYPSGPALLLGAPGAGRTEALARRLGRLVAEGEDALALVSSRLTVARLREIAEERAPGPFEQLVVHTFRSAAVAILREHAEQAGVDPFFECLGTADRLAMLLERREQLPLRRHEIRGNPAGLLARLVERIDALKAAGVGAERFAQWAAETARGGGDAVSTDAVEREREFAELYALHDRLVREAGAIDGGDAVLELTRLLAERPALRAVVSQRYPHLIADELEEACVAERRMLAALAEEHRSLVAACEDEAAVSTGGRAAEWFRRQFEVPTEIRLADSLRVGEAALDAAHAVVAPIEHHEDGWRPAAHETEVRFWRCANERAQAQAVARELEAKLASGEAAAGRICVMVRSAQTDARAVAAALEEHSIPYRLHGAGAFFQRPEVRDVIAWLRLIADPTDAAAAVRALTRPPVELRSVELARCTTIARRRKLDMISALEAALESPQIPPEARDRIQAFLKLYRSAARAMGQLRADVFVRRLIERIGIRRQRLFAAHPEAAERLRNLARLGDLAATWTRREPQGSNRDFVRYLVAVSEAGVRAEDEEDQPAPEAVSLIEMAAAKGREFDDVYLLGLDSASLAETSPTAGEVPAALGEADDCTERDRAAASRRLLYAAMTRARRSLVLAWAEAPAGRAARPSPYLEDARTVLGAVEELQEEELFGPGEGLHSSYRMIRDEVVEEAWRAGGTLSEPRLDTYLDVNQAVVRFLEMVKLAALIQRPGDEPAGEAITAINELLGQAVSEEQRKALAQSGLDAYLLDSDRERRQRERLLASRDQPSLEPFLPKRGEGLALSASDIELYRTCPLKYKFARVFSIPQEQTINQRFGIVIHQVLERFHAAGGEEAGSLEQLMALFAAAWRRAGFGESDDELQFRERAIEALRRYHARQSSGEGRPVWTERAFDFRLGPHHLRGRVDRIDQLPEGGFELIDYKTGDPKPADELAEDVQLAIYRLAAQEAWDLEPEAGSYWYVLADEKVAVRSSVDDPERVERTVLEVGDGILAQDFEPRPSPEICSWCDFRLICPASEA